MKVQKIFAVFITSLLSCNAANLVMFGMDGMTSHLLVMSKLARTFSRAGHAVTAVLTAYDARRINLEGVSIVIYDGEFDNGGKDEFLKKLTELNALDGMLHLLESQDRGCRTMLGSTKMWSAFSAMSKFDLAVLDSAFSCARMVVDLLKIESVDISLVGFMDPMLTEAYGIPMPLATTPMFASGMSNKMTLYERTLNVFHYWTALFFRHFIVQPKFNAIRDEFNVLPPKHWDSMRKSSLVIEFTCFGLEFPRFLPPNVKLVGAALPEAAKPLNAELESWMNMPGDVVFGSLGSMSILTDDMHKEIISAFGLLPPGVRVLWKFNGALPPAVVVPSNVRVESGWVAQNDILGHIKTVAFFSHCGMNSVQEAVYHGKPIVGFPNFADQWDNMQRVVSAGLGLEVSKNEITSMSLADIITRVVYEPSFREAARRLSRISRVHDGPKETLKWVNYVLEIGADHLSTNHATFKMPWYQTWLLDVFGCFAVILLALFVSFRAFCSFFIRVFHGFTQGKRDRCSGGCIRANSNGAGHLLKMKGGLPLVYYGH